MSSFDPFRIDEDATKRGLQAARRDRDNGRYPSFEEMAAELRSRRELSRWSVLDGWRLLFPPPYLGSRDAAAEHRRGPHDDVLGTGWHLRRVAVPGADGYLVKVEVTETSGAPVAGVLVDLALPGDSTARRAATDAGGVATFSGLSESVLDAAQVRLEITAGNVPETANGAAAERA